MHTIASTSTGHVASSASWLDAHFESARPEYEEAVRAVGIKPGWAVLDAGCGGGNFLPLLCEATGTQGTVAAIDLAPENVARVEATLRDELLKTPVQIQAGSILALPFEAARFDCVWCANVTQYLSEAELERAVQEFRRVLKPGGTLALKDFDATVMQFLPMNPDISARFVAARRDKAAGAGPLGTWSTLSLPSRLRKFGLTNIVRKGWLIERWAPVSPATRSWVQTALVYLAAIAVELDIPGADLEAWRSAAANPSGLLDDPDFCLRECFVTAIGQSVS